MSSVDFPVRTLIPCGRHITASFEVHLDLRLDSGLCALQGQHSLSKLTKYYFQSITSNVYLRPYHRPTYDKLLPLIVQTTAISISLAPGSHTLLNCCDDA